MDASTPIEHQTSNPHPCNGYRIRLYVGPIAVKQIAEKLRYAGFTVDCEGTEHIHYRAPYVDGWGSLSACEAVSEAVGMPWVGNLNNFTVINAY
jgi:hypothetical protein